MWAPHGLRCAGFVPGSYSRHVAPIWLFCRYRASILTGTQYRTPARYRIGLYVYPTSAQWSSCGVRNGGTRAAAE